MILAWLRTENAEVRASEHAPFGGWDGDEAFLRTSAQLHPPGKRDVALAGLLEAQTRTISRAIHHAGFEQL